MDTPEAVRKGKKHDATVPAAWVAGVSAHWTAALSYSVEVRKGPRGSARTLKTVTTPTKEPADEDEQRDASTDLAQELWDEAYEYHFEVGGTIDAALVCNGPDGELLRITAGGRMRGGETSDPDSNEEGTTINVMLGALKKLTTLHLDTIDRTNDILKAVAPLFADAAKVREAEIKAEATAYTVHQVESILDRAFDRFGPAVDRWAEAKHHEGVSGRSRKPTGDKVIDAWREVVETMDMPSVARVRALLSEVDGQAFVDALEVGDSFGRGDILEFWKSFRERESVKAQWRELLAAMPSRASAALPAFADAARAAA